MNATKETLDRLKSMAEQAQFVGFQYKTKETGEVARHTLIVGVSYDEQIRRSITALELLKATLRSELEIQAYEELLKSFQNTLSCHAVSEYNPRYTKADAYVDICRNLKYCLSTGVINVSGIQHAKRLIEPGTYKKVNSRPLTIAKNNLRDQLPVSRWREYCVSGENLQVARLQGVELVLDESVP